MRTKDSAIIEIKHSGDNMTRLRFSFPATKDLAIGFGFTLDMESSVIRESWSLFLDPDAAQGEPSLAIAAQILALPFAVQLMDLTDEVWPTWRVDFQRIAEVGGKFRAGNGFVAIKFGDGGTRRIEVKSPAAGRTISERLSDILTQATRDASMLGGGYAGGSVTVSTPIYAPVATDTALADAVRHAFNPS